MQTLLAQHAGHGGAGGNEIAMTVLLVTALVVVWVALGVVCWIFWRAKKRDDAEQKLAEWKNAPSS